MDEFDSHPLAFLDVETTGLSPWFGDRICEIAILRCLGEEILGSFETLVNPERHISPSAARVNGLTDEDLIEAPLFGDIATQVEAYLEDAIIVAHNAPFDLGFVSSELARLGKSLPSAEVIDTLQIARRHFHFPSNGLQAIAYALKIECSTVHRAMADVVITRAVMGHFLARMVKIPTEQYVSISAPPAPVSTTLNLPPLIQEALASKKDLLIRYVDQKGRETQRRITPKQIMVLQDYIYLSAHCHLRDEDRSFRLDRITEMKLEDK
jgi:DNA polymerase-3 subunit epsilon